MNNLVVTLMGTALSLLPSGALHWPERGLLAVSDLHLGKSDRIARSTGVLLPPYETRDTLTRLADDIERTKARCVLCLGDSFDDLAAAEALDEDDAMTIARLLSGRRWIWLEGNHDPGPIALGGEHRVDFREGPLVFRHIALPGAQGEISGHFHPKAYLATRGRRISRPCFLLDEARLIMPAYGTYTGGLAWTASELRSLLGPTARAALTGDRVREVPLPGSPL